MELDSKISIRLYRSKGTITVSPTASAYLKKPTCVRLLIDEGFHKLAIQTCEMGERDSFPLIGKHYEDKHGGIKLRSVTFILQLYDANGLDKKAHYIVPGVIDPQKSDVILFDISKAEKIEEKPTI